MILRTRRSGNVELRSGEFGTDHLIGRPGGGSYSWSGVPVTGASALGLPAVSNVIRSPADVVASMPMLVYNSGEVRTRAENTWQWKLVHEYPNDEQSTYDFFYDMELSLEATQNAFIYKAKSSSRVEALYVYDPHAVRVYRDNQGVKRFDLMNTIKGDRRGLTSNEILHIRGYTPTPGGIVGVSLIEQHKDTIGSSIAMQQFEGDYFRNGAIPSFFFTGAANKDHAEQLIGLHNQRHAGQGNQFKVGALWGQADVKPIPVSMADAAFIEAKRLSVEDACRIWRWPKQLLELTGEPAPLDENAWTARFLKFYLLPRLRRIERAFASDPDLFAGKPLFGEFLTAALERADFVTRVRGYKDARQGGWITANEIRQGENLPARPDGDELLVTPTGSAPNPSPSEEPDDDEPDEVVAPVRSRANGTKDMSVEALLTGVLK